MKKWKMMMNLLTLAKNNTMKAVLIYDESKYQFESDITIKEFDSVEAMIEFINKNNLGGLVLGSYEVYKELKLIPVEKVTIWKIEE